MSLPGDRVETVIEAAERRPPEAVSNGARLLATRMAVAGSSRDRIAARLQDEFGIEDPDAILDEAGL